MSLEQVHVIGKNRRGLRLHWVAGLGIVLALSPMVRAVIGPATTSTALSASPPTTQSCPTSGDTTTLTTLTVTVTSTGGMPSGTVNIEDEAVNGNPVIASATLNTSGQATISLYLADGTHTLVAVYPGGSAYTGSMSPAQSANISAQCNTEFAVSVSDITPSSSSVMTLTPGQAGTAVVTVTPSQAYVTSLSTSGAPAFVTVSCSGLPTLSSCAFTPVSLEVLPGQDAGINSTMLIQTQAQSAGVVPPSRPGRNVAWAILLPGMLGLGGLAWGARRRRWLQRLSLVALVGLVTTLGTAGCSPLYYYYNHGPVPAPATPSGTFTVTIAGQSSNGVAAVTNTTTMQLTVQ